MINQEQKQQTIELTENEVSALMMMIMQLSDIVIAGMKLPKDSRFLPQDCESDYLDAMGKIAAFLVSEDEE